MFLFILFLVYVLTVKKMFLRWTWTSDTWIEIVYNTFYDLIHYNRPFRNGTNSFYPKFKSSYPYIYIVQSFNISNRSNRIHSLKYGFIIDGYIIVKVWCNFFAGVLCSTLDIGPWSLQFVIGFRKVNRCKVFKTLRFSLRYLYFKNWIRDTKDLNNLADI